MLEEVKDSPDPNDPPDPLGRKDPPDPRRVWRDQPDMRDEMALRD